jgi:hypothetical protein
MIPDRANLRFGIFKPGERRLRIWRRRPGWHSRARLNPTGVSQPVENPFRFQPLVVMRRSGARFDRLIAGIAPSSGTADISVA